jgi:hypothetical protein
MNPATMSSPSRTRISRIIIGPSPAPYSYVLIPPDDGELNHGSGSPEAAGDALRRLMLRRYTSGRRRRSSFFAPAGET